MSQSNTGFFGTNTLLIAGAVALGLIWYSNRRVTKRIDSLLSNIEPNEPYYEPEPVYEPPRPAPSPVISVPKQHPLPPKPKRAQATFKPQAEHLLHPQHPPQIVSGNDNEDFTPTPMLLREKK